MNSCLFILTLDFSGLRYLVLNENVLFDAGASALADALSVNSTLTSLEVSGC